MKIQKKLILSFLLVALVSLLAVSFFSYFNARKALTKQILSQLQSVAVSKSDRLKSIVDQNIES